MIFAVDFDGTIVQHEFPKVGPPVPGAVEGLRELVENDHKIILYTMRSGEYLDTAIGYMGGINIPLLGVNHNPEQSQWTDSPKAFAHSYIDDSAVGCPLVYPETGRPYVDWNWVMIEIRACQPQSGGVVSKETAAKLEGRECLMPYWAGPPMGTIDVVPDSGKPLPPNPVADAIMRRGIAAAPETLEQRNELLAALERISFMVAAIPDEMRDNEGHFDSVLDQATAAILKAKGGS